MSTERKKLSAYNDITSIENNDRVPILKKVGSFFSNKKIKWSAIVSKILANNGDPLRAASEITTEITNADNALKATVFPKGYIQYNGIKVTATDDLVVGKMVVDLNGTLYEIAETTLDFNGQGAEWYAIVINENTQVTSFTDIDNFSSGRSGNQLDMYTTYDDNRQYCYNASYGRCIAVVYFDGTNFDYVIQIDNVPKSHIECETDAGQTIGTSSNDVINYEDILVDINSEVTTGAAWVFTACRSKNINVTAAVIFTDSNAWSEGNVAIFTSWKSGVVYRRLKREELQNTGTYTLCLQGSISYSLFKGETAHVTIFQNTGGNLDLSSETTGNYIIITEV